MVFQLKRKPEVSAVPPGNTAPQAGNDRGYAIAFCIPVNESFGRHTNTAGIQVALNHLRWCPPIAAGPTPEEEVQAVGTDVADGSGLVSRSD